MREVGYGQGWGAFRGRKNSRDLGELREGPTGCEKSVRKVSEYVYAGRSGRDEGSTMTQGRSELVLWTLAAPVSFWQGRHSTVATFRKNKGAATCTGEGSWVRGA